MKRERTRSPEKQRPLKKKLLLGSICVGVMTLASICISFGAEDSLGVGNVSTLEANLKSDQEAVVRDVHDQKNITSSCRLFLNQVEKIYALSNDQSISSEQLSDNVAGLMQKMAPCQNALASNIAKAIDADNNVATDKLAVPADRGKLAAAKNGSETRSALDVGATMGIIGGLLIAGMVL